MSSLRLRCRIARAPADPAVIEVALRRGFPFTETQLEVLLRGGALVVDGLDAQRAESLKSRLEAFDLEVSIEPQFPATSTAPIAVARNATVEQSAPAPSPSEEPGVTDVDTPSSMPPAEKMVCPRCGAAQEPSASCVRCGVIFAKLRDTAVADRGSARTSSGTALPPSAADLVLIVAAAVVLAALALVGLLASILSVRATGAVSAGVAGLVVPGAAVLAVWFGLRAIRSSGAVANGLALRVAAGVASVVGAVSLTMVIVLGLGAFSPVPSTGEDQVAALRAKALARRWQRLEAQRREPTPRTSSAPRYPNRADQEYVESELARLGPEEVPRAARMVHGSYPKLEDVSCSYRGQERAWSREGQIVYRLIYDCQATANGRRSAGLVAIAVSFLERGDSWVQGWPDTGPAQFDSVGPFSAP